MWYLALTRIRISYIYRLKATCFYKWTKLCWFSRRGCDNVSEGRWSDSRSVLSGAGLVAFVGCVSAVHGRRRCSLRRDMLTAHLSELGSSVTNELSKQPVRKKSRFHTHTFRNTQFVCWGYFLSILLKIKPVLLKNYISRFISRGLTRWTHGFILAFCRGFPDKDIITESVPKYF